MLQLLNAGCDKERRLNREIGHLILRTFYGRHLDYAENKYYIHRKKGGECLFINEKTGPSSDGMTGG